MSSSDAGQQGRTGNRGESGSGGGWKWVLISLVLIAVAALFFVYRGGMGQGGADAETERRLELTRTALAATENLEAADAELMRRIAALVEPRHRGRWEPWPDA